MARVAREMVAKAGVNVDELVDLLVRNAAAELTTFYYYHFAMQPDWTGGCRHQANRRSRELRTAITSRL